MIAATCVFIPLALVVLHWKWLGIAGVWGALFVWMLVRAACNAARFRRERWTALALSG